VVGQGQVLGPLIVALQVPLAAPAAVVVALAQNVVVVALVPYVAVGVPLVLYVAVVAQAQNVAAAAQYVVAVVALAQNVVAAVILVQYAVAVAHLPAVVETTLAQSVVVVVAAVAPAPCAADGQRLVAVAEFPSAEMLIPLDLELEAEGGSVAPHGAQLLAQPQCSAQPPFAPAGYLKGAGYPGRSCSAQRGRSWPATPPPCSPGTPAEGCSPGERRRLPVGCPPAYSTAPERAQVPEPLPRVYCPASSNFRLRRF